MADNTVLTSECRAIAKRMSDITAIGGNIQVMQQMVYNDPDKLNELRALIEGTASAEMVTNLASAIQRLSNVMECEGNVALHGHLVEAAAWVTEACDFADAEPADAPARKA